MTKTPGETPVERRLAQLQTHIVKGLERRPDDLVTTYCSQPDVDAIDAGREALATLKKLTNEVSAMLGVAERTMRESAGNTNVAVLIQCRDEARALLARCEETRR